MGRLVGEVAIVTGGAWGIGGATARRLAEEGASVLIADVDEAAAQRNAATIQAAGGSAATIVADVGRSADVERVIAAAIERFGKLTILVNNAYGAVSVGNVRGSAVELDEAAWDRGLAVLMKSIFLTVKQAVPHLERAGGGSIVNLASVHGLLMAPRALVYEAGKSAVIGMTRQMACDFGPLGIRVNAICPGHIVTERVQQQWEPHPDGLRFFEQQYPLRRCGRPVDIANAIVFLCSAEASFITGHALVVDGGLTIQLQENLGVQLAHYTQANPETWLPY